MPSRLPNNKFQARSRGHRFNLEKIYLNQMQDYLNKEIRPILVSWIKKEGTFSKVKYNQLERKFDKKILEMSKKHFTDILKLSLTEKYGAWHRVPSHEVQKMLALLLKRSHFLAKGNYFSDKIFSEMLPFMKPSKKIRKLDDFPENMIENIVDRMNKGIGGFARTVYTHSTYFINSAYEIQFKMRDPNDKYRYIWGTRPDLRRTPQCEMIEDLVNKEIKRTGEKGVKLDWLKKTVDKVANMVGFKKANPDIPWCPHFGCRSGIERIVIK